MLSWIYKISVRTVISHMIFKLYELLGCLWTKLVRKFGLWHIHSRVVY